LRCKKFEALQKNLLRMTILFGRLTESRILEIVGRIKVVFTEGEQNGFGIPQGTPKAEDLHLVKSGVKKLLADVELALAAIAKDEILNSKKEKKTVWETVMTDVGVGGEKGKRETEEKILF
jgi:hypothetical protein